ncbi:M48 family metallopeptidase [Paenibacillus chartarius]|uniref:M48 family metallopeptidase n=1 Tax=Paenibacillus chartarius TaxID=747481 RepID=A0ABV6DS72_9BACL
MIGNRWIRGYYAAYAAYAAAIAAYLWWTRGNTVPAELLGSPADPSTFMTAEQLKDSVEYGYWRSLLFFVAPPWEWGVYVTVLFSGAAVRYERWLSGWIKRSWLRIGAYLVTLTLVVFAAVLPLRLAAYGLSRSYGITTQPLGGWLRDKLVAYGVGTLTTAIALGTILWLIRRGGRWWLKLWLLSVPFILFMMVIQPVLIDPLYETFSRLSDPVLERDILRLAAEAGIPADRVYEVAMSAKTNAMNAYVNGIGPTLRIVLWDTTLQRLDHAEIMHIMAHEIGHYAMHHLEWSALGAVGSSLVMIWLGSKLLRYVLTRFGPVWGAGRPDRPHAGLVITLLLLFSSLFSFLTLPLSNAISRQAEHAADLYALQLVGSGTGAVTMNQKLAAGTIDIVNPPLLVYWFRSTHPTDMERIRDASAYRP